MVSVSPQRISTFLWYDSQAEEAATFYTSLFKDSRIISKTPMLVKFALQGQEFFATNGGPHHKFTPAISLHITCDDQDEIDRLYEAFTKDGGAPSRCGWVRDKYGLSWQLVPTILPELMQDPDREKAGRAMQAMLKMDKLDVAALKAAHAGA